MRFIFVGLSMEGYLPEDLKSKAQREREVKGRPEKHVKTGEALVGGILQIIFGALILLIPTYFNNWPAAGAPREITFPQDFYLLLVPVGILSIPQGCVNLCRGLIGNDFAGASIQQKLHIAKAVLKWLEVPFWAIILSNVAIYPWFEWTGTVMQQVPFPVEFHVFYLWIGGFIVFAAVIDAISETYKAVTNQP